MTPLEEFFARADLPVLAKVTGWVLERSGDLVVFEVAARDGDRYRLQLKCDRYPEQPPSVTFVNTEGSSCDPRAWPQGDADFLGVVKPPPNCFLCMPMTLEGLQHHPHWRTEAVNPWDGKRHTLLDLLNQLQRLLNSTGYQRRGP